MVIHPWKGYDAKDEWDSYTEQAGEWKGYEKAGEWKSSDAQAGEWKSYNAKTECKSCTIIKMILNK